MIHRLLEELPELYPAADRWLTRTLSEWHHGTVRINVAEAADRVVGITIAKPKTGDSDKLCTLYVDASWRRLGVGHALLAEAALDWASRDLASVVLTCRLELSGQFTLLLSQFGFRTMGVQTDRYGVGKHEVIYEWRGAARRADAADLAAARLCRSDLLRVEVL
jgi:GNAT superfamily N-acetyltransferase